MSEVNSSSDSSQKHPHSEYSESRHPSETPFEFIKRMMPSFSEEKRTELFQFMRGQPPIKSKDATMHHCVQKDGLNLNIASVTQTIKPSIFIPFDFPERIASDHLCAGLERIYRAWNMQLVDSRRVVIEAILTEVLCTPETATVAGNPDVEHCWEGPGLKYTGSADYVLGINRPICDDFINSIMIVVEAKYGWTDSDIPRVLCEAGCLLKRRQASGLNTPVFAALTNGLFFHFYAIDTDGEVYWSGDAPIMLSKGESGGYTDSKSLQCILRWFAWILESMQCATLGASSKEEREEQIKSLKEVRECFVPAAVKKRVPYKSRLSGNSSNI